jgi:hypothetical protein
MLKPAITNMYPAIGCVIAMSCRAASVQYVQASQAQFRPCRIHLSSRCLVVPRPLLADHNRAQSQLRGFGGAPGPMAAEFRPVSCEVVADLLKGETKDSTVVVDVRGEVSVPRGSCA